MRLNEVKKPTNKPIDFSKDKLEEMVIGLQKQMLDNQDAVMDKIILKACDCDDRNTAGYHG